MRVGGEEGGKEKEEEEEEEKGERRRRGGGEEEESWRRRVRGGGETGGRRRKRRRRATAVEGGGGGEPGGRGRDKSSEFTTCFHPPGGELRDGRVTDSVECYDPVMATWTDVRAMPTPRVDHATCAVPGGLFVSGGTSERRRGGSHVFW